KVYIEKTGAVQLRHPHIVTLVPGKRYSGAAQLPATLQVSAELTNTSNTVTEAVLQYSLNGQTISKTVQLKPRQTELVQLPDFSLENPRLWWPNGYGDQPLYDIVLQVKEKDETSDEEKIRFGVRQIDNKWNAHTGSMQAYVNGQPIFIKGGNWIISDAMLRFSDQRYDAEIRYHRDMNLNLIRIWGGALTERPEFYNACDKYGLLVFQDFWFSGDCNGRWEDPRKADDQWTRRQYPDDHRLVLEAAADQIKMIRNHASLAFWCGGNEITPPEDILLPLKDTLLPALDGTRYFFDYSNSDSMSLNTLGGNGDGPYGIQPVSHFWSQRTFPYNSEIGSVGLGDYASLQRFIPEKNLVPPANDRSVDSVWAYHKYIGYGSHLKPYGEVKDAADFAMKAQLVNYDQYRALAEGFSSHIWDWYTGVIIWKTQNPWTALRGQMYDYYLDVNACLYGLRNGSEALHIMFNPTDSMVYLVNNGFTTRRDLMMEAAAVDIETGEVIPGTSVFNEIGASLSKKYFGLGGFLKKLDRKNGVFVLLRLREKDKTLVSENLYWLPGADGNHTALQAMPEAKLTVTASRKEGNKIQVELQNAAGGPVAFFNRIAVIDKSTGKRVLPAFFSDNYVSVLPGAKKTIEIEIINTATALQLEYYGWNTARRLIDL
ncbi:MAG: glycoside hydrolase family 2 TIM barrel-domain containing protein, partial [Flavihumibacter sp.]